MTRPAAPRTPRRGRRSAGAAAPRAHRHEAGRVLDGDRRGRAVPVCIDWPDQLGHRQPRLAAHARHRHGPEHLRHPRAGRRAVAVARRGHLGRPLPRPGRADHSRRRVGGRRHLDLRCLARGSPPSRRGDAVRAFCQALFSLVLRIFFRRIEVSGLAHVPSDGPVIFVLNHPSGLIDPAFLLCLAPRRVALLAKAPLFRMPVIAMLCRAFEAIPVHLLQDAGADPVANRQTFETARALLASGGAIALFPDAASHSEPRLRPLQTGAARIALGAAAGLTGPPIQIVPAGLYYRAKRTFRSAALLHFGEPFVVDPVPLAPGEEPPAGPVRELTARIERALASVTLHAEHAEGLALAEREQRIVAARDGLAA